MELIIQKAVELGAYQIVPVATKRAVVKLDKKKEEAKLKALERYFRERGQAVQASHYPGDRPCYEL